MLLMEVYGHPAWVKNTLVNLSEVLAMVPFVHQQQAWTIGTSWGPGAFLLS